MKSALYSNHIRFMRIAMREAEKARGLCSPNPFVGAVIVKNGTIIARGHTQVYGGDHAEIQAIKKAGESTEGADIYVTLEPCSHYGKTPPCSEAIITAKFRRVIYGIRDPNPLVNPRPDEDGPGIISMRASGIEVQGGVLAAEINRQLESWTHFVTTGRPFLTLKTALSLDGKYAADDGSSRWITGLEARKYVHVLRAQSDVVLSGIGTVLADDPMLNVRYGTSRHQPVRVVLDSSIQIPIDSALVKSAGEYPLYVFHTNDVRTDKERELLDLGVKTFRVDKADFGLDLGEVFEVLHDEGYYNIFAECGDRLSSALIASKLVDKVIVFLSPKLVGGRRSIFSNITRPNIHDALCFDDVSIRMIGDDIMLQAYPRY